MTLAVPARRVLVAAVVAVLLVGGSLSVPLAEGRALTAEESHLTERLSSARCLTDWGVDEGAGPARSASVTGVSPGGLRVSVVVPYAYSMPYENETLHADAASEAVYLVGIDARRLDGTAVSPC